jgi:methanethiol S-methyltransferase
MVALFAVLNAILVYFVVLVTILYAIRFVSEPAVSQRPTRNGLINTTLLGLFAVQHGVMATQSSERRSMRFLPAAIERSMFLLFSALALLLPSARR